MQLDTILLSKAFSNIPISTSMENMLLSMGINNCYSVTFNSSFELYKYIDSRRVEDTIYYFNSILCPKKMVSYIEKEGKVRLRYIDFKRNKYSFISSDKVTLSRQLTLEELMKIYKYTFEDIAGPQIGILAPYPMQKQRCFYQVNFSTGEHDNVNLELYFDCKKKLRYIQITPYYF